MLYNMSKYVKVYTNEAGECRGVKLVGKTKDKDGAPRYVDLWVDGKDVRIDTAHDGTKVLKIRIIDADIVPPKKGEEKGSTVKAPEAVDDFGKTPFDGTMQQMCI